MDSGNTPKHNLQVQIFQFVFFFYVGQFLDHYNARPGTTFPSNADDVILAVPSPNMCAKQCTVTANCKSFDYCADSKTCRLKNTHELDVPSAVFQKAPDCNHYSREYRYVITYMYIA